MIIFNNPNIYVRFDNKNNLQFIFESSSEFNENEYYTYKSLNNKKISCNNIIDIQIQDYLFNNPLNDSDSYDIIKIKQINNNYLCLQINHEIDIKVNDEIGLFQSDKEEINIEKNLFIKKSVKNYLITDFKPIDISKKYKFILIKHNITLNCIY